MNRLLGSSSLKLKNKIALLCTMLVVLSTSFSGLMMYRNATTVTVDTEIVHSSKVMTQVNNYLNEKLKGIITRILALRTDNQFNEMATRFLIEDDPRYHVYALSYFSNVFLEMRYSDPFISSVFLYTPKESFYDLSLPHYSGISFTDTDMYREIMEKPNTFVYWLPRSRSEIYRLDDHVVSFVVRFSINGYNEELFMVVHLDEREIMDYLRDSQSTDGSMTFIVDNGSGELVAGDFPLLQRMIDDAEVWNRLLHDDGGMFKKSYEHDEYMIYYKPMNVAPWSLVRMQSQRSLLDKLQHMQDNFVFILLAGIAVGVVVALLLAATISKPLQLLARTMQKVRLRNFDVRFEYKRQDEVGSLARTFNMMTEAIRELNEQQNRNIAQLQFEKEQVQTEQKLKRIAELKALQSQITPHFLYNTLDSIKWKAEKEGQRDIAGMITTLATFFRISLSRGKEIITVKEELEHVVSYLTIQEMRYHDRFSYELNSTPHLDKFKTVKFILQPLVENAIYHGIKQLDEPGRIRIHAESDGKCLKMIVEDNGPGIHPLKLRLIEKQLQSVQAEQSDGYGLYNVNDRIKLHFGREYGLRIASERGKGTRVTAVLPLISDDEEDIRHVQSIDC